MVADVAGRASRRGLLAAVGPFALIACGGGAPNVGALTRPRRCLFGLVSVKIIVAPSPFQMPLRVPASIIRPGLSALPRTPFPPPELKNVALKTPGALKLSADDWGSLQAPSPASLAALAARLSFHPSTSAASSSVTSSATTVKASDLLEQALTHPSCLSLYSKHYPNAPLPSTNQSLSAVGNGLLGLFAAEWVHASYPHLPNRAAKAAVSAYVGPRTLADVAKEWGALSVLRWSQTVSSVNYPNPL